MLDERKLISVFHELSKQSFTVSDDTVLDKLYDNIVNNEDVKDLLNSGWPEIGDWLETIVQAWNTNELFYGVKIFTLCFVGFVGSNPKGFNMLHTRGVLLHVRELITSPEIQRDSSIMQPLINILGKFLSHQDGWKWIIDTMVWRNIVEVFHEERSIFVKKTGLKVLSLLLSTSVEYDSYTGMIILNTICGELIINNLIAVESLSTSADNFLCPKTSSDSENKIYKGETIKVSTSLTKSAKNLCDLLQDLLPKDARIPGKLALVARISGDVKESVITSDIFSSCTSAQECQTFVQLLLMVELSNIKKQNYNSLDDTGPCPLSPVHLHVDGIIRSLASKGYCCVVSHFCVTCLSWCAKWKHSKDCYDSSCRACSEFESRIVYCLRIFLHSHVYSSNCCGIGSCVHYSTLRKKMRSNSSAAVTSVGESLFNQLTAECLSEEGHKQKLTLQYIQLGVFGLTRSLDFIQNSKNVEKIFSDVLLALKTMIKLFKSHEDLVKPVLLHLLTLTRNLVERCTLPFFNIVVESDKNIFMQTMKIIEIECSDIRVTVAALQTLNVILKYHIMPDLVKNIELLQKRPKFRDQLCKLELKLSCASWEVRDTTLEVLQTMIEVEETSPWIFLDSFEKKLLDTILEAASIDESAYVRASALNFFTRIVRAKQLSNVKPQILSELGIKILLGDDLPSARRAACDLLTALNISYVPLGDMCSRIDLDVRNKMYKAVFQASVKDFDWEVKKAALMFWHCTVNKCFMEGKVPLNPSPLYLSKHPTSKEETCTQILATFNTLGEIGCLKAIWLCLTDETDLQVALEAQEIVQNFEKLDKQWKFTNYLTKENNNSDQSGDSELEPSCQELDCNKFFDLLRKQDWKERLQSRKNWLKLGDDELTLLMDLILNLNNRIIDCDHNMLDCY